jgi:hypothetical protein
MIFARSILIRCVDLKGATSLVKETIPNASHVPMIFGTFVGAAGI